MHSLDAFESPPLRHGLRLQCPRQYLDRSPRSDGPGGFGPKVTLEQRFRQKPAAGSAKSAEQDEPTLAPLTFETCFCSSLTQALFTECSDRTTKQVRVSCKCGRGGVTRCAMLSAGAGLCFSNGGTGVGFDDCVGVYGFPVFDDAPSPS